MGQMSQSRGLNGDDIRVLGLARLDRLVRYRFVGVASEGSGDLFGPLTSILILAQP